VQVVTRLRLDAALIILLLSVKLNRWDDLARWANGCPPSKLLVENPTHHGRQGWFQDCTGDYSLQVSHTAVWYHTGLLLSRFVGVDPRPERSSFHLKHFYVLTFGSTQPNLALVPAALANRSDLCGSSSSLGVETQRQWSKLAILRTTLLC